MEKLVLVGAVCNDEALEIPIVKLGMLPLIGEVLTPFMLDSKLLSKARMKQTLAPSSHHLIDDERVESVIRPLKAKDAHHSVLAAARRWDANRIQQDAHLINQPTLLIWGENDTVIPVHNGQCLYDLILKSRLVVLKDCGHLPQEEKSEKFVEFGSEFCRAKKVRDELTD